MKAIFKLTFIAIAAFTFCFIPSLAYESVSPEQNNVLFADNYGYRNISVSKVSIFDGEYEVVKAIEIMCGESKSFKAEIYPWNASDKYIRWRSSNNEVATVDENGTVIGVAEGTVGIYAVARSSGIQDAITIKVIPYVRYPDSISIVPQENANYETGSEVKFNVSFFPADATVEDLRWSISGNCATINQSGDVTITDKGIACVKAYTTDRQLSAEYTFESIFNTNHFAPIGESWNVKSNRPVIITFDEAVSPYFLNSSIFAAADKDGNESPIDISISVMGKQIIITPINGWSMGSSYIFIKRNICDTYGNILGRNLKYKIVNTRGDNVEKSKP